MVDTYLRDQVALNKIQIRISERNPFLVRDLINGKCFAKLSSVVMDAIKAIKVM